MPQQPSLTIKVTHKKWGTFSNDSRVAQELGIPQLKQEESASASIGFTATFPEANIKIAVDGYFIAIEDRVTLTDTFSASSSELEIAFEKCRSW